MRRCWTKVWHLDDRPVTYLSNRKASLSIDRLVDLGLNSDDARINHVLEKNCIPLCASSDGPP